MILRAEPGMRAIPVAAAEGCVRGRSPRQAVHRVAWVLRLLRSRTQPSAAATGGDQEIAGKKNAPNQSGRQMCSAAVSFLSGLQRLMSQAKQISGTVLLQSSRSAR